MAVTFIQSGIGNSDLCKRSTKVRELQVLLKTRFIGGANE